MKSFTFLFTEIADSISLAQRNDEHYRSALLIYKQIIEEVISVNKGIIFNVTGAGFCCSFEDPIDAVNSAVSITSAINNDKTVMCGIKLKMGINTGEAEWTGSDYSGYITLAKVSRLMSVAYGGQILVSDSTYDLVKDRLPPDITFRDLGERKLKDITRPVRLYQLLKEGFTQDFPPLRTLDARPNNLPADLSSFIGRKKEISEIKSLMRDTRLLTLIGPGGTGKTRLMIHAAADLIDEFENGVLLVELASLKDPALVNEAIASELGIRDTGGSGLSDSITQHLKDKQLLLLLDNCEHLLNECANVAESLLKQCPGLKIMTSSREALKIIGEITIQIPVMKVPDPATSYSKESIIDNEAVRLFVERASAVKTDFILTDDNARTIALLCNRLDGIPLALELAAARIKVFNPEKILENLDNRFNLLRGNDRLSLPKQQTLRAMMDWSYELLSEKEKKIFAELSVFSGGCTIDAVEKICSNEEIDEYEVLDLISNLSDKSLITSKEKDGMVRFGMLETIRQYAFEMLPGDSDVLRKHYEYYNDIAGNLNDDIGYRSDPEWEKLMNQEFGNMRTAVGWISEHDIGSGAPLILKLADFNELRGNYSASLELLKMILDNDRVDIEMRAKAWVSAAYMFGQTDHRDLAEKYIGLAESHYKQTGNKINQAEAANVHGVISYLFGDSENSFRKYTEAIEYTNDIDAKLTAANIRSNFATYYSGSGDSQKAIEMLKEAIEIYKKNNAIEMEAKSRISIGGAYLQMGDLEKAEEEFMTGLPVLKQLNDYYAVAATLYNLGNLNFTLKKYNESEIYFRDAIEMASEYGHPGIADRSKVKLGEIYLRRKENIKAKNVFTGLLATFGPDTEKLKTVLSIYGLAKYFYEEKNYENALKLFILTRRISEVINFKFSKSRMAEENGIMEDIRVNMENGKFRSAADEAEQYDINDAINIALELSR